MSNGLDLKENLRKEDYSDFESYLRYLFSINNEKMLPKGRSIYYRFKGEYRDPQQVSDQLLNISTSIEYFMDYISPHRDEENLLSKDTKHLLADIAEIGIHSIIPFILELLKAIEKEKYSNKDGKMLLTTLIVMLVRNKMQSSNPKYDTFFPSLFKRIKNGSKEPQQALLAIIERAGFHVKNDDFIAAFKEKRLYYDKDKKFPYYILKNIDKEMTQCEQNIDYSSFSQIEHILPQMDREKLNDQWKRNLEDDLNKDKHDESFDIIKNTLGNLTIMGSGNQAVKDKYISVS